MALLETLWSKVLAQPVWGTLSGLRVTAPLLFAVLFYPQKLQSILPARLHPLLKSPAFIRVLKVLVSVSIVQKLNNKLSQLALNNWKSDAKFIKSQEVILISGGSSGIGELMTRTFAGKGVKVVVFDLEPPKNPLPSNAHFYRVDVTSSSQIASAAAEIRKAHGDPTVLINNAGIGTCRTILAGSEEGIRKTFEVNTISHFLMVKEFLPSMIRTNHGHVVTLASLASYVVHAQNVDYCCTKASALAFHEGLASELKARYKAPDVRTTIVHPTWTRTPLIEQLLANPSFNNQTVIEAKVVSDAIVKQVLSGRSAQLILPAEFHPLSTIRGWPSWLQVSARNSIGHVLAFVDGN